MGYKNNHKYTFSFQCRCQYRFVKTKLEIMANFKPFGGLYLDLWVSGCLVTKHSVKIIIKLSPNPILLSQSHEKNKLKL